MKEKLKDFKCSCGCGQKLRVLYIVWKNGYLLDIGIIKDKERRPKIGVVLRSDEVELGKFIKFLPKQVKKHPKFKVRIKKIN